MRTRPYILLAVLVLIVFVIVNFAFLAQTTGSSTSQPTESTNGRTPTRTDGKIPTYKPKEKFKVKIVALPLLVTSRHSENRALEEQAFVSALLQSWAQSVSGRKDIRYSFYIGYDKGDPLYDNQKNLPKLISLLDMYIKGTGTTYKLVMLQEQSANTIAMWNQLVGMAYKDGADYYYLLHDDSKVMSKDWAPILIDAIETKTAYSGLGVVSTRDEDSGFEDCGPYPFISRLHLDIFGGNNMHPSDFTNHGGEVYLCALYKNLDSSFVVEEVTTRNHQELKTEGSQRYVADTSFEKGFEEIVKDSVQTVQAYLDRKGVVLRHASHCLSNGQCVFTD